MPTEVVVPKENSDKAELTLPDGRKFYFPMVEATHGADALDVSGFFKESGGATLLDPSYGDMAACKSEITFVDGKGDGDRAVLLYRGIPIEQLASHTSYLEASYLLLNGALPNSRELANFEKSVKEHTVSHPAMERFIKALPLTDHTHPMGMLGSAIDALHAMYPTKDRNPGELVREYFPVFLAQLPILAAQCHRHRMGLDFIPPDVKRPTIENFLYMMFGDGSRKVEISPIKVETLEKIMILHADHEQNASTTAVRNITSANANPFAAVTGGIGALWGSLHGGANEKVVEMLLSIERGGGDVDTFIERAKGAKDPKDRLMGFGHRIYEAYDPRAAVMKDLAERYFQIYGRSDPLLEIAKGLEERALSDPYSIQRKLYPNVDFYSGILLRAMAFPTEEFTVIFALGRVAGWLAQANEQANDPKGRIARPRQVYVGDARHDYESNSAVAEVKRACRGSEIDFERLLDITIRQFGARGGTIHIIGEDGMLHLKAGGQGMPESVLRVISVIPVGKGMAGTAVQQAAPVSSCNIQNDTSGNVRPGALSTMLQGAIAVPIFQGQHVVGALGIGMEGTHNFDANETALLLEIGREIGNSLDMPQHQQFVNSSSSTRESSLNPTNSMAGTDQSY